MPREESYTIAEPGAGDVTDGSVDYYPMEWEIVGRDSLSAARSVRAGRSAADEPDAAPLRRQPPAAERRRRRDGERMNKGQLCAGGAGFVLYTEQNVFG